MEFEEEYIEEYLQDDYDNFFTVYKPKVYEVTDENRKLVSTLDPKKVWTYHTTCEDTFISPGFLEFSTSSCCWKEYVWYVSELPWKNDNSSTWVRVNHVFSCPKCNPESTETGKFDLDCEVCEGQGTYRYSAEGHGTFDVKGV